MYKERNSSQVVDGGVFSGIAETLRNRETIDSKKCLEDALETSSPSTSKGGDGRETNRPSDPSASSGRPVGISSTRTTFEKTKHPDDAKASRGRRALLLTLAALTIPAAFLVNSIVPTPYMDEEFHVRQVQHYCRGDFKYWDPKITTFPGLYFVSLLYIRALLPLGQILGFRPSANDVCQPGVLRSVNILLSFICALLFREIILHFDLERDMVGASVKALVLSLYPLHWFFNFLYYTELGSATAVMAMYLASLKRAYWISALFGAISVLLRQTNAVWIIFVLCVGVLDFIQHDPAWMRKLWFDDERLPAVKEQNSAFPMPNLGNVSIVEDGSAPLKPAADKELRTDGLRMRHSVRGVAMSSEDGQDYILMPSRYLVQSLVSRDIFSEVWCLVKSAWCRRHEILWNFGPLLLVVLAFIGFLLHNGSIVVGDKSAHTVSPHFAQLLYCGLVSAGFLAPLHFSPQNLSYIFLMLKTSSRKSCLACCITASVAAYIAVHYFSSAHPYLVADNRHYVFYIWKDVFQRHWSIKYLMIPLYLLSWLSILGNLGKSQKVLWMVAFCLALVGVLVPTPLLEFRYYNVPFYFMFLHSCQKISNEKYKLALMALQFMAVNFATVYIFLFWPFKWPSEPEKLQRFIW